MERSAFPFPLAASSSHHSLYHRFLLGVAPSMIAPFPKPYCIGALVGPLRSLTGELDLPKWRKLYHAAFPWIAGFGREHYGLGLVPPHRPLPAEYRRPLRRFGAFDFVQVADPAFSAIALVGGDRRALERFVALGDAFGIEVQAGVRPLGSELPAGQTTGRLLAGQFAEPNNRWLMPFLHIHTRVLNFTSFEQDPARMLCLDPEALGRRGAQVRSGWAQRQAGVLEELGYRVSSCTPDGLAVRGVPERLLAAMEAPRIAVLRILERMISGSRPPSADRLSGELPLAVIARLADRIERMLARPDSPFKPAKLAIPYEGPWRDSVREHLNSACPRELRVLDEACARARRVPIETAVFCSPAGDAAHDHCPQRSAFDAPPQTPWEPELAGAAPSYAGRDGAPGWLQDEFSLALGEVHRSLVRFDARDPLMALRRLLPQLDAVPAGATLEQLAQADAFLRAEFERRDRAHAWDPAASRIRGSLAPLDALFPEREMTSLACERERGGRSL